jgi:sigma-B regulation protein RsbU (phosphoserine phosphatase)
VSLTAAAMAEKEMPDTTRELIARIQGLSPTVGDAVGIAQALNLHAGALDDPTAAEDLRKILTACNALLDMTTAPEHMLLAHGDESTDVRRQARHELRTPINVIKGYGEMLAEDAEGGANSMLLPDLRRLVGMADGLLLDIDGLFRVSTASVEVPACDRTDITVPNDSPVKHSGPQGRILAVDDIPENLAVLSRRLERLGHSVVTTTSGKEALLLLQKEAFDLVLLDVMMPEMDGYEVLSRIKSAPQTADIPVVMISALNEMASVVRCLDAGAEDYLPKPFDPTLLRARIGSCLEKKHLRDVERTYLKRLEMRAETLARELEAARRMQQSILPMRYPQCPDNISNKRCGREQCGRFPVCPGIRLCASMIPAKEVGGDFYDFFWLDNHHLGFAVADVSGKGVPAALFMSLSLALLRTLAPVSEGPADCLSRLNLQLCRDNEMSMFVTLFYGIYDAHSGILRYANAGHSSPVMTGMAGEIACLPRVAGAALGAIDDCQFAENSIELPPGATLCVYTDGVTEAVNQGFEEFGEQRLADVLMATQGKSVDGILAKVLGAVDEFAKGMPQADDITCLILRRANTRRHDTMRLVLTNQLPEILRLADAIDDFASCHALARKVGFPLNLVLDEILTNIISYGFAPGVRSEIEVDLFLDDDKIVARILDSGKAFNPLDQPEPDLESSLEDREVGGLGVHFARKLMDEVDYWRQGDKNCLLLVKRFENIPKEVI